MQYTVDGTGFRRMILSWTCVRYKLSCRLQVHDRRTCVVGFFTMSDNLAAVKLNVPLLRR